MSGFQIPTISTPKDFLTEVADFRLSGYTYGVKFGERTLPSASTAYLVHPPSITTPRLSVAQTCTVSSSSSADTFTGTGARQVEVAGITTDGTEVTEIVNLNGTSNVDTTNPYSIIHRVVVLSAGSGKVNAGNISVKDKATGTSVIGFVEIGRSITDQCFYQVPAGKNLTIRKVRVTADTISGGNPTVTWRLWFYSNTLGNGESKVEGYKFIHSVQETGNTIEVDGFIVSRATPGTYIELEAISDKNNTVVRGSFHFILVDV